MKYTKHIKLMGILSLVLTLVVGILFSAHGSAATAGFYVSPGAQTVTIGSSFNVAVRINASSQSVDTVQVHITYPSDKLQLVGSVSYAGSPFESHAAESTSAGNISFIAYTTGSAPNSDVLIATVAFSPIATGTADVSFASDTAAASSGLDVTGSKSGGNYTIQSAPQPAPSPTGGGSTSSTSSGSSSGGSTSGSTAGNANNGTSSSSTSVAGDQASGVLVPINDQSTNGTELAATNSDKKFLGISQQYWKNAAIIGGIVLVVLGVWAFFWVRTGKILPFVGNSIKPNKYSYKADPDIGPTVVGGLSNTESPMVTGGSMEDRLDKVQGVRTHAPGDTIHPTTPSQGA